MIIEDDENLVIMMKYLLEREELELVIWDSDFEKLLTDEPWNGVEGALVDLMLPGVSGVEILEYLKEYHPTIKRIVLSASAHFNEKARELSHEWLTKPSSSEDIVSALQGTYDE